MTGSRDCCRTRWGRSLVSGRGLSCTPQGEPADGSRRGT